MGELWKNRGKIIGLVAMLGPLSVGTLSHARGESLGSDALSAYVLSDQEIQAACSGDSVCTEIYLRIRTIALRYRNEELALAEALAQRDEKCDQAAGQASCLDAARNSAVNAKEANERLASLAREAQAELAALGAGK